ncbi:MAG: DUF4350 domain-containing protein [Actinomycetota bacterium]
MNRRTALILLGLFVLLGALAWLFSPVPPEDAGPTGTLALKRLLTGRGIDLSISADPGASGSTFFLLHDFRTDEDARRVLEWVRSGGRLVLADPRSAIVAQAGLLPGEPVGGLLPGQDLEADCLLPATVGVERIVSAQTDMVFEVTGPQDLGCFGRDGLSYLVQRRIGEGEIVALGGATPFTNEYLDEQDDVVLAWNLLGAPGGEVVFARPVGPGGRESRGLWSLLPTGARVIILQVLLAAVLFAVSRARRLGPPVEEAIPSPIPATELVVATGELYRRTRSSPHAVALLQRRFRARAARKLGLPPDATDQALAAAISVATGAPEEQVQSAMAPRADEQGMVAMAREIEALERRLGEEVAWR